MRTSAKEGHPILETWIRYPREVQPFSEILGGCRETREPQARNSAATTTHASEVAAMNVDSTPASPAISQITHSIPTVSLQEQIALEIAAALQPPLTKIPTKYISMMMFFFGEAVLNDSS